MCDMSYYVSMSMNKDSFLTSFVFYENALINYSLN